MFCKICKEKSDKIFSTKILNKYDADYYYCDNCGFLSVDNPHWLNEAYESPINISDTGIIRRNIYFSFLAVNVIFCFFKYKKTFLDYAGGYGIFTRLMRDVGLDFKWHDDFSENLVSRGFEYSQNDKYIELVTAFEVAEHFIDPVYEFERIFKISKNILFSTELLPIDIPKPQDWWYYGTNHGQHISFYSKKTFNFIAKKYKLNYYTNNKNIHLFSDKKVNIFVFRLLTNNKLGFIIWLCFKLILKSKTWSDYLFLVNKK